MTDPAAQLAEATDALVRAEIAKSVRELGELMGRFTDSADELERLCERTEARLEQLRQTLPRLAA